MKVIIFGAGPSGLYTAIKLKKEGVEDILVCDPRAGSFVRLGDLERNVFQLAQEGLREELLWEDEKAPHIKNFERRLYSLAEKLGIGFETKQFVRFGSSKKVIIANKDNSEQEELSCDYVFDCTGSKRVLAHAVNQHTKENIFELQPVVKNIPIKNHLIAYVTLNNGNPLNPNKRTERNYILSHNIPQYLEVFSKLKVLGWKEVVLPYCYVKKISKNRQCIYTEAPDDLPGSKMIEWLETVIKCVTGSNETTFKLLKDSKNKHPRLALFSVNPQQLSTSFYENEALPTIIVQGDAQIDPNYTLAHGVKNAIKRINQMISCFQIAEGKIMHFDKNKYKNAMAESLEEHRQQLISKYDGQKVEIVDMLQGLAYTLTNNEKNSSEAENLRLEVKGLLAEKSFEQASELLSKMAQIKSFDNEDTDLKPIREAYSLFETAKKNLPKKSLKLLNNSIEEQQIKLVQILIQRGDKSNESKKFYDAITSYEQAIEYYESSPKEYEQQILALYAKIVVIYNRWNKPKDAIDNAEKALAYPSTQCNVFKRKILFHAIQSAANALKEDFSDIKCAEQALKLYTKNTKFINEYLSGVLEKPLNTIKKGLNVIEPYSTVNNPNPKKWN